MQPAHLCLWILDLGFSQKSSRPLAESGCLSNHFLDQGEQKKIYWQLQVSRITLDRHNPTWNKKDLTPPFVYNCFDPSLKIDFNKVNIDFQRADLDIFEL